VTLGPGSLLPDVVAVVARALRRAKIRSVLTGGACASLYAEGTVTSFDLDFILQSPVTQAALDAALAPVGFRRDRDHYVHSSCPFWVEFPPGPLGIGADAEVKSVSKLVRRVPVACLSATDACRDRLAAYYHWNDVQSLATAVEIARRQRVNVRLVEEWSAREGAMDKFAVFTAHLAGARRRRRKP
jgi:hypothetical protein